MAKAFIYEARGTIPTAGSAEQRLLDAVRQNISADAHPLRTIAGENPPNEQMIKALVRENIGTYNPDGRRKPLDQIEQARFNKGNRLAEIYGRILTGDRLRLLAADADVKQAIETILLQNDSLRQQYWALSGGNQVVVIDSLLRDPAFKAEVARLLAERAGPDKLIQSNILQLRGEEKALADQKSQLEAEKQQLEQQLQQNRAERKEYTSYIDSTGGWKEGQFVTRSAEIKGEIGSLSNEVDILKREINKLTDLIDSLEARKQQYVLDRDTNLDDSAVTRKISQIDQDLNALKQQLSSKRTELESKQKALSKKEQELQGIEDRRAVLESAIQQAEERLDQIVDQLAEINPKLAAKRTELHRALAEKAVKESEFISSLESILPEAVSKAINERMDVLVAEQLKIDEQNKERAKTELEKKARDEIARRSKDGGKIRWEDFDRDWETFMTQGPDELLRQILGADFPAVQADPELYNQLITDLKTKMGRLRLLRPGKGWRKLRPGPQPLSKEEIINIWDTFGDEYFDQILSGNQEMQERIKKVVGEGVLDFKGKIGEQLRSLSLGKRLLILAILLGAVVVGGGALGVGPAAGMIR